MSKPQGQRVALEKDFFWHGVLVMNENHCYSFFDVRTKKEVRDNPNMIGLLTTDVPALPLNASDSMRVIFRIENNVFGLGTKFQIAEAEIQGSDLVHCVEGQNPLPSPVTVSVPGNQSNQAGEFEYSLQDKTYILRSVLLLVPTAQLRKYVKE